LNTLFNSQQHTQAYFLTPPYVKAPILLMIFKVLILGTVFSTGSTANYEDGDSAQLRIINGDRAPYDAYQWFAKGNGCGATLVSPEFVITASHCDEYRFDRVRIGAVCTGNANEDYGNCDSDFEVRYSKNMFEPDNGGDLKLIQLTERSTITPADIDRGLSDSYVGGTYKWCQRKATLDPCDTLMIIHLF
jgi:V8-like Glu-specific endopeptidase